MKKMENVADIYPLTPTQQGILYHTIRAPESEVYFEQIRCMLDGPLDVLKMQAAWDTVVERHPVLRTAFLWEGLDTPLQVVRQTVTIPWDIRDWQTTTETVETQLEKLAGDYRQKGFNLAKAPLLRMVLVKLADERHHFIWNFHHLMTDGWSTHQVFKEAFDVYESLVRGEQPTLPTIKPFRNYVAWLKKQDNAAAESFWREQLAGFETPTPLQVDKRGANTSISYAEADIHLTTETTAALNALARQNRLTLGTLVQGAWAILLSRYSGEQDVSFGITLSGRPASPPGVENMVGMFINTLPLRTPVPDSQPLLPWLEQLQSRQLAVRQYEHTPLSNVQRWSDVPAGQSLFDSIVVFENYPAPEDNGQQSLTINDMRYREQSNYPLALLVVPDEQMRLLVIYNQNRFEADTIQRLLGHLTTLLAAIAAQPELTLGELPLLTDRERIQIFREWNDTATSAPLSAGVSLPPETCIHNLIAEYGDTTPDKTAVSAHDGSLTYAELITRANQLAHRLIALGVSPGTPVGLYSERSAEMGVGILGIMQAGGAYVPLDPAYPPERVAFVLADTNAPLVVSQVHLAANLPQTTADIVPLDSTLADEPMDMPQTPALSTAEVAVSPDDLAYLIYTTGSTGTPKGVMVNHRNLLASTQAREHVYDEPVSSYLLLSSFAFDSSVAGIFWTLLQGGKLVLPAPGDEKDVAQLAKLVEKEQVSHTLALPSLYRLLLAYAPAGRLDSLRVAIVAGEACPPDLSVEHYGRLPHAALVNEYGPTEATVWCTSYHFPRVMDGTATSAALSAGLHANHLETALNQLVQHHAALRMVFHRTVMGWSVGVETAVSAQLQRISLAQQLPAEQDTAMMEKATQLQNTFDLAASPLLRAALFDLGPSRPPRLLLIVHHLVVDAVSWRILLADLEHAYQQVVIGQPVELPKPLTSLAQWSQHLSKFAQDRQFQQERDYWLQTAPSTMTFLSAGNSKIENTEANAAFVTAELDAVYTNALLREMHQAYHTKIDDVLLTALLHTTHEWTGRRDLLLSLERHGREEVDSQLDVSQTVGWFTSLFPTTLTLAESDDLGDSLQQVKSHLHSIPQQGIGYGVLRYLADDETRQQLAALPQPEILFNYLGQVDSLGAGSLFRPIHADVGPGYGLENRRAHVLDVNARVENGRFPNPQSPPPRQQHGIPPAGYVA